MPCDGLGKGGGGALNTLEKKKHRWPPVRSSLRKAPTGE